MAGRLVYLVTPAHAYTMRSFLRTWGSDLRGRVGVVPYTNLPERLRASSVIFSDLERLGRDELDAGARLWERLRHAGVRVLNDPGQAMLRYDLLRRLAEDGTNPFGVFRCTEDLSGVRYPAFVREAGEHTGALSGLCHNMRELRRAIARCVARGIRLRDLLVVEFCDTRSDDGIYRKIAVFRIGERIIARHIFFDRHWVVKGLSDVDDALAREEEAFVRHRGEGPLAWDFLRGWARGIFERAQIDYGRMDLGVCDGRPVVWEINTNPMVTSTPSDTQVLRQELQGLFASRARRAFAALAHGPSRAVPIDAGLRRVLARATGEARGLERVRRGSGRRAGGAIEIVTRPLLIRRIGRVSRS